ncbi:MAG TPA: helix-turn-helix domain-containing protein [Planctomycetota bacterium]|nr:helix-turn-helix domain-containing protein [Planctomycetota bacterium]
MHSPVSVITGFRFDLRGGATYPPHRHRTLEIVHHVRGSGTLNFPGQDPMPFAADEVHLCPARQVHHQAMEDAGTDLCLLLTLRTGQTPPITEPLAVRGNLSATLRQEIVHLTTAPQSTTTADRSERDLRAATVLAGLLARAEPCTARPRAASVAEDIARHLAEHYGDITFLDEVAHTFALSSSTLRQRFAAHHGEPPLRYLTRVRVERAKDLLAHSSLSLKEIAQACGFANDQYLCAVFRRVEGKAPGTFRNA